MTEKESVLRAIGRMRIDTVSGCWLWKGQRSDKGYGMIRRGNSGLSAHRAIFEWFRGPIPNGLQADHLCRVRECVNPWHIEPVTAKENTLRGFGPTAINARATVCKNGHALTEDNIYLSPRGSRNCRICRSDASRARIRADHDAPKVVREWCASFRQTLANSDPEDIWPEADFNLLAYFEKRYGL